MAYFLKDKRQYHKTIIVLLYLLFLAIRIHVSLRYANFIINTDELLFFKFAQAYANGALNICRESMFLIVLNIT